MGLYDTEDSITKSFDADFIPEEQLQARWAELIELKKAITEISRRQGRPLRMLDLGVGSARVAGHLSRIPEIWDKIGFYDGIDNAPACVQLTGRFIADNGLQNKMAVHHLEAENLSQTGKRPDLVICTWFTPGNFHPPGFSFEQYDPALQRLDLDDNPQFRKVFAAAWDFLLPGGEILLGACYLDNEATRLRQEAFYRKIGMTVITDAQDSFTATREKFWSQRFTEEKLKHYFRFAPDADIQFIALDTYDYAMQVRVRKGC